MTSEIESLKTEARRGKEPTWIVKSDDPEFPYICLAGEGLAPDQRDADRFGTERRALRARRHAVKCFAGRMAGQLTFRVVKLVPLRCLVCRSNVYALAKRRPLCADAIRCASRELGQIRDADEPNGFGYRLDGGARRG